MNQLHPQFGFNETMEICRHCKQEGAIILHGDNIPTEAPFETETACHGACKYLKIVVFVEVNGRNETGYCPVAPLDKVGHLVDGQPGPVKVHKRDLEVMMGASYREDYDNQD
jgi:hypothetical protein